MKSLRSFGMGLTLTLAYFSSNLAYDSRNATATDSSTPKAPVTLETAVQGTPNPLEKILESIEIYSTDNQNNVLLTDERDVLKDPHFRDKSCVLVSPNQLTLYAPKNKNTMVHFLAGNPYAPAHKKSLFMLRAIGSQTTESTLTISPYKDGSQITIDGPCLIFNGLVSLNYNGTKITHKRNFFNKEDPNFLGKTIKNYDLSQITPLKVTYPHETVWVFSEDGKVSVKRKSKD